MNWLKALFGQSGPSNLISKADSIWMSAEGKYAGISEELNKAALEQPVAILLVAHFDDTLAQLIELTQKHQSSIPVAAVKAQELNSEIASGFDAQEFHALYIIVGERHPLPKEDDRVIQQFANDLRCKCIVQFHLSLDDGIMRPFATDSVKQILEQLGIRGNDRIRSSLVEKRIRKYQLQLATRATGNQQAATAAEWLSLNTQNQ